MLGFGVRHCSFICSDRYVDTLTNQICSLTIIEIDHLIQIFSSSFVTSFIFILLCLAADFWAVKNVTGRFLVGLRWRNQVDPVTGTSTWVYESRSEGNFIIRDQPTRIFYKNYFRGLQTKTSSPQWISNFLGWIDYLSSFMGAIWIDGIIYTQGKNWNLSTENLTKFVFSSFGSQYVWLDFASMVRISMVISDVK